MDTDVNLDGLVANAGADAAYDDPPLRRGSRGRFEFPQLTKPGVYVIDFIGGGKSSRALVRKGRLRPLVATGTAGQKVTGRRREEPAGDGATVWLGGKEYRAGQGRRRRSCRSARAPAGSRSCSAAATSPASITSSHQPETYRLAAGIHVDREALLTRSGSRPCWSGRGLYLNGTPVSVKLLEDVKLRITVDRPRRHRDDDRGAGLQAVRGPRVDRTSSASRRGWRRSASRSPRR